MVDDPVDDLLNALDDELSGHPSPAMLARVREATAGSPASARFRWIAAVVVVGAAVSAFIAWPVRPGPQSEHDAIVPTTTMAHGTERAVVSPPPVPPRHGAKTSRAVSTATTDRRDDVVVSPDVLLGIQQLGREFAAGRLTPESLDPKPWTFEPVVITPTIIEPTMVTIAVDADGGGGGRDDRPLSSPPSRTGSVL